MADLPKDCENEAPPFTYCGVDHFGTFLLKERQSELNRYVALLTCLNRYGTLLTCLVSKSIVATMDIDSFTMAFWRMITRRGNIRSMRSDNGKNFVGTESELKRAFQEMHHTKIKHFPQENRADWMVWTRNT